MIKKESATTSDASQYNEDVIIGCIHKQIEVTRTGAWRYLGRCYEATSHPDTKKLAAQPGWHGM